MGPSSSAARKRTSTPKKPLSKPLPSKKPARPNASILSFFQKTEKPEPTLFLEGHDKLVVPQNAEGVEPEIYDAEPWEEERFNEVEAPIKKRRLIQEEEKEEGEPSAAKKPASPIQSEATPSSPTLESKSSKKQSTKRKGPFLDDSDSEGDAGPAKKSGFLGTIRNRPPIVPPIRSENKAHPVKLEEENLTPLVPSEGEEATPLGKETSCPPPPLKVEDVIDAEFANVDDFCDLDDFPDDEDFGGEEYRMMQYMEKQARLEAEAENGDTGDYSCDDLADPLRPSDAMVANCPICDGSLAGITSDEATRHVNACLDGNPIPLPQPKENKKPKKEDLSRSPILELPEVGKRFARAAVPRQGQANPFNLSEVENKPTSAFSKLMSGHAEDAAWAGAAAAEHSARGKPAYQRTCPFYKIMPGFYICVDAFRYGAVKGCSAYFLSHFHSDHYIGLTANWTHGPIYCSKVTADLVKMQLRVAAHWVRPLEFDETVDVPGTEGVTVTMIPANHCPGSSLFLFEKTMGKGPNAKKQRILHCGDFRACPAHVGHPLLKPEVLESISGKVKQQKIDVCYLDTTYLNPRYSFPPQNDVIKACADMCKSLAPDQSLEDNTWDKINREAGTETVSKFFTKTNVDGEAPKAKPKNAPKERLLVICGTYSIGKERICKAIAQALGSKIFASKSKIRICSKLGDPELTALMTDNPYEAQVHMQMLMEIRAETLQEYLNSYKPHFSRIVGFRPSGWNYRPQGASKAVTASTQPGTIPTTQILQGKAWRSRFGAKDFVAQRGSTKEAMCFGVPYSEHSSFRELAMFVMSLHIEKVVPTVNVGSEVSRKRMKGWIDKWLAERRKGGLIRPLEGEESEDKEVTLWDGKDSRGGGVWW
ncbi:dna repair metallo-beta-lactamase [Colletotrichum incanum]|uniref:Dna repair metallo-beta-lactamase n=1 Tax=Colletotrichum incanum TaxID=1573173 RepID=A0A161W2Q0_COLIC|nr:dna repair metallo-beta-lactamase [Colletotrichum incanum]OHW93041.1 DNA repair metallo-beta-lactamase [Colletotrichum incanum]